MGTASTMRGFIRRRGASWELRAFLGRDPVSGRKGYATRSVRGSRREAERVPREMVAAAEDVALLTGPALRPARCVRPG
jgi:hypothetical protein